MRYSKPDFVPRLADAGLDDVILTAFNDTITSEALVEIVNASTGLGLSEADLHYYISQRGGLGLIVTGGSLASQIARPDAPTGLGQDKAAVWFSEPTGGKLTIRWYVNGGLVSEDTRDCATNRAMPKSALECKEGDVIQVCVVDDNGVVGWWARIEVA